MSTDLLIGLLRGAGADVHVEDLLDAFWLATRGRSLSLHVAAEEQPAAQTTARAAGSSEREPKTFERPTADSNTPRNVEFPDTHSNDAAVYAPGKFAEPDSNTRASPVALPAGHALPGRLQLSRALKPFRRRWPSTHELDLDEERTVEMTASLGGQLYPVFRPQQERWFDVDVVLEDDPSVNVWCDTLRDFCQMLRDTGAFRNVHCWRLRLTQSADDLQSDKGAILVGPTGHQVAARALGGTGARRLILLAAHGSSSRWMDGTYARMLAGWSRAASVLLLHLLERRHWKRTPLGEPHGVCYALEAGATTESLRVERNWWTLVDEESNVPVPVAPLTPQGIGEWALMQMGRARRTPVYLLDATTEAFVEHRPQSRREFEHAVALLREASLEAFRLAVALSSGPFTLPVARLIQEARFGADAKPQHLAEVFLSGLVYVRSPPDEPDAPNEWYYDFYDEARGVLLRSLRQADADLLAGALERRVSEYIESIGGRAVTFRALIADSNGQYNLPKWAQPFAQVGLNLLGRGAHGRTAAEVINDFAQRAGGAMLARVAQLAAATPIGGAIDPAKVESDLWEALRIHRLVQQDTEGTWRLLAGGEPHLKRVAETQLLAGVRILWVDDHSENNFGEIARFRQQGAMIVLAKDTESGLELVRGTRPDLIISDMARGDAPTAGLELLAALSSRSVAIPTIIYASHFASTGTGRLSALRAGAFACTNQPEELFKLVLEATQRSLHAPFAREHRVWLELIRESVPNATPAMVRRPRQLAAYVLATGRGNDALGRALRVIKSFADSHINHLIALDDGQLRFLAVVLDGDAIAPRSQHDAQSEIIDRAAREGTTIWIPDVRDASDYLANDVSTRSALVLPLHSPGEVPAKCIGIVSIEMRIPNALDDAQIAWLEEFATELVEPVHSLLENRDKTAPATTDIEPEDQTIELSGARDYAVVAVSLNENTRWVERSAAHFVDWLVSVAGGGLPRDHVNHFIGRGVPVSLESVTQALAALPGGRRLYVYVATAPMQQGVALSQTIDAAIATAFSFEWFDEVVIVVETLGPWRSHYRRQRALLADTRRSRSAKLFLCIGRHESREAAVTPLILEGLSGMAAGIDGGIDSLALVRFLRDRHASMELETIGSIVFAPGMALVRVSIPAASAPATVQIIGAGSGRVIARERLEGYSAQFKLPVGAYRALHVESGVAANFAVHRVPDIIDVPVVEREQIVRQIVREMVDFAGKPGQPQGLASKQGRRILLSFESDVSSQGPSGMPSRSRIVRRFCEAMSSVGSDGREQRVVRAFPDARRMFTPAHFSYEAELTHSYAAIAERYEPRDELFIIGAGSGALVACELASWIDVVGLVKDPAESEASYAAYCAYRAAGDRAEPGRLPDTHHVTIEFVGLWDCIGIGTRPMPGISRHAVFLPSNVRSANHALAIDESRLDYQPTLWTAPELSPGQELQQLWFSGTHDDLSSVDGSLMDRTLLWMAERARSKGLGIDESALPEITSEYFRANVTRFDLSMAWRPRRIGRMPDGYESVDSFALDRYEFDPQYRPAALVDYLRNQRSSPDDGI